ncbi:hypothetical protein BJ546DRAFT_107232 [Cryomyces antarcticus]
MGREGPVATGGTLGFVVACCIIHCSSIPGSTSTFRLMRRNGREHDRQGTERSTLEILSCGLRRRWVCGEGPRGRGARIEQISRDDRLHVVGGGSEEIILDLVVREKSKAVQNKRNRIQRASHVGNQCSDVHSCSILGASTTFRIEAKQDLLPPS